METAVLRVSPNKFKTHKSGSKMLASVFWGKDGILLVDYMEKGATITAKYVLRCTSRQTEAATDLQTSRQAFERNLVLQDNASLNKAAITHQKLADLHFEFLKRPAYSPDLAPSDYYLFPNLKKHFRRRKFSSIEEAILTADGCFAAQPKERFLDRLKKLEQRSHKCVELKGEYIE
jgi:histone-lysine N-methyltransferase SETMAR